MQIEILAEGFLNSNCYLLKSGDRAFIVDPAARFAVMREALLRDGLTLDGVLLTHGHFDHVTNLEPLLKSYPVPVYLGEGDKDFPSDGRKNAFTTFFGRPCTYPAATDLLCDGDVLRLGDETLTVIATPGHSGGSVCFLYEGADTPFLITGDTLFADNVGRTDLYGGSYPVLCDSLSCLADLAKRLPDVTVYPGHGETARLKDALRAVL